MPKSTKLSERFVRLHAYLSVAVLLAAAGCHGDDALSSNPVEKPDAIKAAAIPATQASLTSVSELPRVYLDTRYPTPTGRTLNVGPGSNLQTVINQAQPGDVIQLPAGSTFKGNFTLPKKTGSGWIIIRSSGNLPAEGTRVTPAHAPQLAKLVSGNTNPTLATQAGASNYRLVGLEITGPTSGNLWTLVLLGSTSQTSAQVPQNIILDRVYIHATPSQASFACVQMNSARTAIINSWIDQCHATAGVSVDGSYAIRSTHGPGPFHIENNYLAASGVNLMFGGSDPSISGLVASDITIRRNYFYKNPAWKGVWVAKNLLESKNSQRVLVEGNVFNGSWADGQAGHALVLWSANQSGRCTWCVTQDWTVRRNRVYDSGLGMTVLEGNGSGFIPARRITVQHNVFDRLNTGVYSGSASAAGVPVQTIGSIADLVFEHNTFVVTAFSVGAFRFTTGKLTRFVYRNNIVTRGRSGVVGYSEGTSALNTFAPGAVFGGNVVIGAPASLYPAGNYFPASLAATGFVNTASYNWRLAAGSPYKGRATDGTDPGADIAAVEAATGGVAQ